MSLWRQCKCRTFTLRQQRSLRKTYCLTKRADRIFEKTFGKQIVTCDVNIFFHLFFQNKNPVFI